MKQIYVASLYAGDVEKNTEFAKKACRYAMIVIGKVKCNQQAEAPTMAMAAGMV